MDSQRLVDSLTAHLALYHSSSPTNPNPNLNPRSAVLRWFSSLPSATRQSALTAVDPDLLGLLLRMLRRLRHRGPGLFFLLPDLPSPHSLPSLCFRPADGLLARAAAADPAAAAIAASILLFSSSLDAPRLDSLTLSDKLVADVHLFVSTMDGISDGRFLSGEVSVSDLMSPWVEMQWLKDKGYYGVEAFVANRIEVALRLAWAESNAGRKQKGGRLKDKGGTGTAGVAANAFWRKKGCVDWWSGLDPKLRKKIFTAFLGKTARTLVLLRSQPELFSVEIVVVSCNG